MMHTMHQYLEYHDKFSKVIEKELMYLGKNQNTLQDGVIGSTFFKNLEAKN